MSFTTLLLWITACIYGFQVWLLTRSEWARLQGVARSSLIRSDFTAAPRFSFMATSLSRGLSFSLFNTGHRWIRPSRLTRRLVTSTGGTPSNAEESAESLAKRYAVDGGQVKIGSFLQVFSVHCNLLLFALR